MRRSATLVQLSGSEDTTNWPVTKVPLSAGLAASSVNCWPSPDFDVGAIAQAFSRLLPAGFYYKTFMWPNWHLFEPAIRRAAGLGRAPTSEPEHLRYETRFPSLRRASDRGGTGGPDGGSGRRTERRARSAGRRRYLDRRSSSCRRGSRRRPPGVRLVEGYRCGPRSDGHRTLFKRCDGVGPP